MGDMTVVSYLAEEGEDCGRYCGLHGNSSGYLNFGTVCESDYRLVPELSSVQNEAMEIDENGSCVTWNQEGKPFDLDFHTDSSLCMDGPTDSLTADQIYRQDEDGDTLLHTAIISKRTSLALDFIRAAPTLEALFIKNKIQQSPLHLAILTDLVPVVRKLVASGVNITEQYRQNTPLHMACSRRNVDMVKALLEPVQYQETLDLKFRPPFQKIPQDLETRNGDGLTPLHVAACQGSIEIVSLLVQKGADVNAGEGKTGRTALHNASLKGDIDMVKTIIAMADCDVNARAMDDFTPFDFARFGNQNEIQILLARVGAGADSVE